MTHEIGHRPGPGGDPTASERDHQEAWYARAIDEHVEVVEVVDANDDNNDDDSSGSDVEGIEFVDEEEVARIMARSNKR